MYKVFISHSKKDEVIAKAFIDKVLVGALGLNLNCDIFCTSVDGAKIPPSNNWRLQIKEALICSTVSILIITPNYRESEVCMNEMGAIWACSENIISLIMEPINSSDFSALLSDRQMEQLTDKTGLDRTKDQLVGFLGIQRCKSDNWTRQKEELRSAVREYLKKAPFSAPISRTTFNEMERELSEINKTYESLYDKNKSLKLQYEELKQLKDRDDVSKLEHKYSDKTEYDKFEQLASDVRTLTKNIPGVILTLIYNDFSRNKLLVDCGLYEAELKQAIAKEWIDDDFYIKNHESINRIIEKIHELEDFLKYEASPETCELIEKDHSGISINIKNLDFWEKVLHIRLDYK